jgi:hypothetical protein
MEWHKCKKEQDSALGERPGVVPFGMAPMLFRKTRDFKPRNDELGYTQRIKRELVAL